jgi:divalent anion:Na+ symporter, DASS family
MIAPAFPSNAARGGVGSGYLTQGELYRLGLLTTVFCLLVFLVIGTPWLLFVAR